MKTHKIRLANDSLTFAAAHFITFCGGECETLHGHDFRVTLELEAELNADGGYVMDFMALQQAVRETLNVLEHKILLPDRNPHLQLTVREVEAEVTPDIQGWVSSVGKWLTEVNDYRAAEESPGDSSGEAAEDKPGDLPEEFQHLLEMHGHGKPPAPPLSSEMRLPSPPERGDEQAAVSTLFFQEGGLKAEVEIRHKGRRWVFPEEECVILPLENTTAELLADYLLQKILQHAFFRNAAPPRSVRLELTESVGMTGICEIRNET